MQRYIGYKKNRQFNAANWLGYLGIIIYILFGGS